MVAVDAVAMDARRGEGGGRAARQDRHAESCHQGRESTQRTCGTGMGEKHRLLLRWPGCLLEVPGFANPPRGGGAFVGMGGGCAGCNAGAGCSGSGPIRPVLCLYRRAFGLSTGAFERSSEAWTYVPRAPKGP